MLLCLVSKRQLEFGLSFEIDGIIRKQAKKLFQTAKFSSCFSRADCVLKYRRFPNKGKRTSDFKSKYWMYNLSDLNMYLFPKSYF